MSISIDDKYNFYNSYVSSSANIENSMAEREYFKKISDKYSDVNLYISNSPVLKVNKLSVSISAVFLNKALNNSKCDNRLNYLLDQMKTLPSYISSFSLNGPKVKSVGMTIDKNGDISTTIQLKSDKNS